jgi:UDP-N-acetylmuramate--alanine ligase
MREEIRPGRTLHFIGIGGIGMSGIARLCLAQGCRVQGSDIKHSEMLTELESVGAKVFIGHQASHVAGADAIVYSSSIPEDHPERQEAKRRGLRSLHRADALAELCRGKFVVAVAGTHGKTTTTALTGSVLKEAGREPSIVVGGVVSSFGGNAYQGKGREIVIEADESDSSFLKYSPSIAVVTNIEEEHLDHFKDIAEIERAFEDFLCGMAKGGSWVGCAEDARVRQMAKRVGRAELYGFDRATAAWHAQNVRECPDGQRGASYEAWHGDVRLGEVRLKTMGRHNVLNSLAALAVGMKLEVPFPTIAAALGHYPGAGRRFDVKYEDKDHLVVDDYAHHPTEVRKTLEAARALRKQRVFALFQPHRYSRTELLMEQFKKSFDHADKLFITDIYAASEAPRPGVSGLALQEEVRRAGHPDAHYVERGRLAEAAAAEMRPGDLVLVMGAGDISQVARQLSDHLRQNGAGDPFASLRGRVFQKEPLAKHTTLKIGGPADHWVEPADEADLKEALRCAQGRGLPVTVFGSGSNLLPPDEGIRGAVLHLGSAHFREIRFENGIVTARAGVPNTLFIQFAMQHGLGGCEFLLGIPGNIGGAVAMNAGSHGQSISPLVQSVTTVAMDGQRRVRKASEVPFQYRRWGVQGEIIVEASFLLPKADRSDVQNRLEEYRQYRASTQDLRYPSAGCMFKNPDMPGCSSGKLIDEAGLKGLRVGNAQVSEKHANFIVNLGGASAADIKELIERVRSAVRAKHGIELETEVKVLR